MPATCFSENRLPPLIGWMGVGTRLAGRTLTSECMLENPTMERQAAVTRWCQIWNRLTYNIVLRIAYTIHSLQPSIQTHQSSRPNDKVSPRVPSINSKVMYAALWFPDNEMTTMKQHRRTQHHSHNWQQQRRKVHGYHGLQTPKYTEHEKERKEQEGNNNNILDQQPFRPAERWAHPRSDAVLRVSFGSKPHSMQATTSCGELLRDPVVRQTSSPSSNLEIV